MGYPERAVLLTAAMTSPSRGRTETPPGRTKGPHQQQRDRSPQRRLVSSGGKRCGMRSMGSVGSMGSSSGGGSNGGGSFSSEAPPVSPLESNFSAFSRGLGWLLRTGMVADVVLVLRTKSCSRDGSGMSEHGRMTTDSREKGVRDQCYDGDGGDAIGCSESGARQVVGAAHISHVGVSRGSLDTDVKAGAGKDANGDIRFLAHSLVLASRSEKFAAMLRFVRRQDDSNDVWAVGDYDSSSTGDGLEGSIESTGDIDCCTRQSDGYDDSGSASAGGLEQVVGAPEEAGCVELEKGGGGTESPFTEDCCRPQGHRLRRRPRRDPTPRELELHSPLLSARSLGLFLDFLYTGVLNPSLSTRELSELALVADEYLVLDLTHQVEALLVERLVRHFGISVQR